MKKKKLQFLPDPLRSIIRKGYYYVVELDKQLSKPFLYPSTFTKKEIHSFKEQLEKSKNMIEFGMGGSTFLAVFNSNVTIHSIDSSKDWIKIMRQYKAIQLAESRRLTLHYVDIGETGSWGKPVETADPANFPKFSSEIFDYLGDKKSEIDTVFIDGRFRVACVLKSILELNNNENLVIMVHDFWNRKEYHVILKYLDTLDKADRLGVFKLKPDISLHKVKVDYQKYKYIYR